MRIHEKRTSFALIVLIVIAISTPLVTFFYGYSTGYLKGSSKGRYFALLEVERTFKEGLLGKSTIYLMGADGELKRIDAVADFDLFQQADRKVQVPGGVIEVPGDVRKECFLVDAHMKVAPTRGN